MSDPFATGLSDAETTLTGYAATAMPVVAAVAVAFLGLKWVRRIINKL